MPDFAKRKSGTSDAGLREVGKRRADVVGSGAGGPGLCPLRVGETGMTHVIECGRSV